MFFYPRSKSRPAHLGTYPLENLPRIPNSEPTKVDPKHLTSRRPAAAGKLTTALHKYRDIFARFADGEPAAAKAPLPDDLQRRTADIKGGAYFMDADQVGICTLADDDRLKDHQTPDHDHAIVILVAAARIPETGNPAHQWVTDAGLAPSDTRAAEIAICIAGHIRTMGFSAKAHFDAHSNVDMANLSIKAGLTMPSNGKLECPFIGDRFSLAVITTAYALATDHPLKADALKSPGLPYWWGSNGAVSGRERRRRNRRASHLSQYPMETVKRIDRPTTLILDDEVPRVPKRAAFFERALNGDLGEKSRKERARFAFKTPFATSLLGAIRAMVPHQDGELDSPDADDLKDPVENARAIKSLSYALGADLTGICEIPRYAWFSHSEDGSEIEMYHRYAIVMLIDQGFDTMEGASGDDWASGAQSMRAYLRGAEIAGVMAEFLRSKGISARPQTNADSDVLHIPLVLWAGLGELSRIGELVLNPFVGPRFKSVVVTTDLPLQIDKPIDFGLQEFCSSCLKCARECPCDAIPFGGKVMFNAYEIWKPDVERCTRYRLTNPRGAACGRCMKTCPINKIVDADGALLTRLGSWLGINAMWLKPVMIPFATWIDDWLGNGNRNPAKKWWFDHEMIDGVAVTPPKGTNERDIDPSRKVDPAKQKIAYYNADQMPPPDDRSAFPLDRKAALLAAQVIEDPAEAKTRVQADGPSPHHYQATPTTSSKSSGKTITSPYKS